MVERLKLGLEEVAKPICPTCHIDMPWFQSTMISPDPLTIDHCFVCPNCRRTEMRTTSRSRSVEAAPPRKLSAPYLRLVR